jgi:hypothetical protein
MVSVNNYFQKIENGSGEIRARTEQMATNPIGKKNVVKTISLKGTEYEAAAERVKNLGLRGFSVYVQALIRQDLRQRGDLVFREEVKPSPRKPRR